MLVIIAIITGICLVMTAMVVWSMDCPKLLEPEQTASGCGLLFLLPFELVASIIAACIY